MSHKQTQTASIPLPHPSKGLFAAAFSWVVLGTLAVLMAHILG